MKAESGKDFTGSFWKREKTEKNLLKDRERANLLTDFFYQD